ncbi:sensor histidine kinase [Chitinimonas sp. BJB300]|uniref:sensor histidine kinase n=1 Tax=Chitinimonas sp. BJB300 TaxID=1559339 RepID=UPI000C1028CC|nr:sensor histidine kinase [Chitinimonas sp. BJB300]PHV12269.1 sensor histidine kinase [Chitinimonas sp. BJB300]TSJ84782.1 HAMP domain-containing protein [Chitinimonas sp. BJB300]
MARAPALSLRRQLLIWLLLPQLVLWLTAAFITYSVALRYANEVIDRSLAGSSRALARLVKPLGEGLYIDFPRAAREILEEDPSDRLYYMVSTPPGAFILGEKAVPMPPPGQGQTYHQPYFYDGVLQGKAVRVAALYLPVGSASHPQSILVQVAKSTALRTQLARDIFVDTVLPLSILIVLTSLLVWMGISRGLLPLRHLRKLVENRSSRDLALLEVEDAPAEVRALAQAINGLLGEVNAQVANQRRFIADAAHQLRTPLAGLKSQTELARVELDEPEPDHATLAQRLGLVETSVARAIRLVNQLLALARAEPEAPLSHMPVDLARLAREVTMEAVPRALADQIDLGIDTVPSQLLISGHESLLRELLSNLIDNAIQYCPPGSKVDINVLDEGAVVTVEVADNGPGIPVQERDRAFERFYRGRMEGQGKGCGLGLAIVQEIARRHHAEVQLADNKPQGLRVSVYFRLP